MSKIGILFVLTVLLLETNQIESGIGLTYMVMADLDFPMNIGKFNNEIVSSTNS